MELGTKRELTAFRMGAIAGHRAVLTMLKNFHEETIRLELRSLVPLPPVSMRAAAGLFVWRVAHMELRFQAGGGNGANQANDVAGASERSGQDGAIDPGTERSSQEDQPGA